MEAMTSVDHLVGRIAGVFRKTFFRRDQSASPGELTEHLKNTVLHRLHDLSRGAWREKIDVRTLNRLTLFGAVLGRVAHAEAGISRTELTRVRQLLQSRFPRLEASLLDWVAQAVDESASAHMDRQGLLSEFNRVSDSAEREELLDAAFAVAAADNEISEPELEELRLISNYLWLDPRTFNRIRLKWTRSP
jgi:uncharacterized tellurite resistance protein B-like protein